MNKKFSYIIYEVACYQLVLAHYVRYMILDLSIYERPNNADLSRRDIHYWMTEGKEASTDAGS